MSPNQLGPVNESISGDPRGRIRSPTRMIPAQRTIADGLDVSHHSCIDGRAGCPRDAGRFGELCRGGGGGGEAEDVIGRRPSRCRPGPGGRVPCQRWRGRSPAATGAGRWPGSARAEVCPASNVVPPAAASRSLRSTAAEAAFCHGDRCSTLSALSSPQTASSLAGCWRPSLPRSHGPRRRRPTSPGWTAARSPSVTIQRNVPGARTHRP